MHASVVNTCAFGDYVRNVRPMTLTQALSQTQADAAEVGFVDMSGFNGSVFAFAGPQKSYQQCSPNQ